MKKENTPVPPSEAHDIQPDVMESKPQKELNFKRKWLWTLLFIVIAAASIWAVAMYSKQFSGESFRTYLHRASFGGLAAAVLCMLAFVYFEAAAILHISRAFGYGASTRDGFLYASSDIYFSAITPSATGGQPACAYFMMKDGIPGAVVTVVLLVNLAMYTLSILCIGLLCLIVRPGIFLGFNLLSRILVIIGCTFQGGLVFIFFLLLKKEKLFHAICDGTLRLLGRLHLLRHIDRKRQKLTVAIADYRRYASIAIAHKKMLIGAFVYNFLQRMAQLMVAVFAFFATGGSLSNAVDIWAAQSYVVLGSNCIPVPGAMGVADYLMLDAYDQWMDRAAAANLELLSRSLSFYCCILFCGVSVLIMYCIRKARRKSS